ncbi:hypothetical protein PROSTU_04356 [Providencia stuartii ATCC 25827]|uniref:Uncharacterized protein n=1 Tax=Providencia stuartii ATCC 25827 TaxID=471874 RepID=A0AA86YWH8_PROST|nr:hypothetical protein PROSTU_04356 [Providencia stuartii ATCC 25827]
MKKEELIDLFNEHADLINMGTSLMLQVKNGLNLRKKRYP